MRVNLENLTNKKRRSLFVANLYKDIGMPKHSYNVATCQNYMKFLADAAKKNYRNVNRGGCKDRYCPNCQRAYYLKNNAILSSVANYLSKKRTRSGKHSKYSFLFITLTIPNAKPTICSVKNTQTRLKNDVRKFLNLPILKGWGKDKHGHACHGRLLGALAKFEQTVNHNNLTLNIHAHVMALVHSDYYLHYFLNRNSWSDLWATACGNRYIINVEAPFFKDNCGRRRSVRGFSLNAIKEMSKYETKSQDFLDILKNGGNHFVGVKRAMKPFKALVYGISGSKRYISYGLLRKLLRLCKNKISENKSDNTRYAYKAGFRWHKSVYNSNFLPLSDREKICLIAKGLHTTPLKNTYLQNHISLVVSDYVKSKNKEKRQFFSNRTDIIKKSFDYNIKQVDACLLNNAYKKYVENYQYDITSCIELNRRIDYNTEHPKECFVNSGIIPFSANPFSDKSLFARASDYVKSFNSALRTEFYNYFNSAVELIRNVVLRSNQNYDTKNVVISLIPKYVSQSIK